MKKLLTLLVLLCGVAACKKPAVEVPAPAPAPVAKALSAIVATCASAGGEVEVRREGLAYWEPVKVGDVFHAGDWVKTGKGAFAKVAFLTGGGLDLEESAVVAIDVGKASVAKPGEKQRETNQVQVESGVVHAFMADPAEGVALTPLIVRTREGRQVRVEARASGAPVSVRLSATASGGTDIAVTEGAAVLAVGDEERSLHKGQAVAVEAGSAPSTVAELIAFPGSIEPGIDARFLFKPDVIIRLGWKQVAGAKGYKVQIARDLSFQSMAASAAVESLAYAFVPPTDGVFVWRVAAKDEQGRWGEFGFARRVFCEKVQPKDLLVGPADGAVVKFNEASARVVLTWLPSGEGTTYKVVLNTTTDLLIRPVQTKLVTDQQKVELEGVAAGEYFWGVYLDGKLAEPLFLKPRRLAVQKVAKTQMKTPAKINEWGND